MSAPRKPSQLRAADCGLVGLGRRGLTCWLIAALLGPASSALSQPSGWPTLPGLPRQAGPAPVASAASASADSPLTDAQDRERLTSELAEVRRLTDQIDGANAGAAAPPGISQEELAQAVRTLGQWTFAIDGQLQSLLGIASARAELAAAQAANSAWAGPGGKPPYSILMVDDWARDAESHRTKIAALRAASVVADRELDRMRETVRLAGTALRRAQEAVRTARDTDIAPAAWRAQAAGWAASAEGTSLAAVARDRQLTLDKVALEQEQLGLVMRKLSAVAGQVVFSAEDLAQVRRTEQTRQARLDKDAAQARVAAEQLAREFDAANRALQGLRAGPAVAPDERLDVAEAQVRSLGMALDTGRRDVETLATLNTLSVATLEMWALRFDALNAGDADRRREATAGLRKLLDGVQVWKAFANGEMSVVQAERAEQAARQERTGLSPDILRHEAAASESLRLRALRIQQLVEAIDRVDRALRRWLEEIGGALQDLPWRDRAAMAWGQASEVGRTVWRFELFAVEDTVDLQGQKVTISRGVTVGKSVGAALLFIVGYLLAASLARRLERTLTRRFGVGLAQARTVRRWALALVAFLLLVVTLNLAQIPLTVFAFLGGALAIGVGFGTQTIIKNFISGLIVLMERQIRVGDIVDIDGTTGTVAEVNLRSSTIKGFDGIDAIVPNSTLLEGKVTNWTMSDQKVRRIVRVGVAYGSPTDQVGQRILDCAHRHGRVLKQPEPKVLFEEFGDNALNFALQFWVDVGAGADAPTIMSDLRYMIAKGFAEGGISMAFPQRDVHLDTLRPLQVELFRRAPGGEPKAG